MPKVLSVKKDTLFAIGCLFAVILAFTELDAVTQAMKKALALCAGAVVPSLFPFLILTSFLLSSPKAVSLLSLSARPLSRLLGTSPKGAIAFLFGTLFGFPIGAKVVAEAIKCGDMDEEEGERLLLFSNNASPAFLVGGVGLGMLGSAKAGAFLFFLQFSVSLAVGLFTRRKPAPRGDATLFTRSSSFTDIVREASLQILAICGYILFFSVLSALFTAHLGNDWLCALVYSLCELGSGCARASSLSPAFSLPLCAFASCFSGLSVFFQCKDAIRDTSLTMKGYLPVKLLCGIAAAVLCYFLFPFFS